MFRTVACKLTQAATTRSSSLSIGSKVFHGSSRLNSTSTSYVFPPAISVRPPLSYVVSKNPDDLPNIPRSEESAAANARFFADDVNTVISETVKQYVLHFDLQLWYPFTEEEEENNVWNASSTLKKRRLKMNKHKYRKRRKRDRQRSK